MRNCNWSLTGKKLIPIVSYINEKYAIHPGYPGYEVSNYSSIRTIEERPVSHYTEHNGYNRASLRNIDRESKHIDIHRHILEMIRPMIEMGFLEVDHINGNKTVNIFEPDTPRNNLRWVRKNQNAQHAILVRRFIESGYNPDILRFTHYYFISHYSHNDFLDLLYDKYDIIYLLDYLKLNDNKQIRELISEFAKQIYENKDIVIDTLIPFLDQHNY